MSESSQLRELFIVGAGPAGITAAIYAARKRMDFAVFSADVGGRAILASMEESYTGYQFVSGDDLAERFQEALKAYGFEFRMDEVQRVEREGNTFKVMMSDAGTRSARTVIVATGRKPKELNVPGEAEFKNRGVTYCATCDAPLFEGLDVAVVGGGNSGLEAVLQLAKIAKSVHLIEAGPQLRATQVLVEKSRASDRVKVWTDTQVAEIIGEKAVTEIRVQKNGERTLLPVQGVFVEIGSVPNSGLVDFVAKNIWGEIIVNCKAETGVPGLFAAGDVTDVPEKQVVIAAGEGGKATLSAFRYLSRSPGP
ncbi:MAG TPA: FAD-dependent oxidoreductase [Candidatus Bathyarchaeia archaeon]|nr:FAD-dependent oxidoreductase [Candidatus Bathyarchaeia archaeon]